MSILGTVRENSIMHRVAEAVITHPKKSFTVREIWETLNNDYPGIKIAAVSHCLTKSNAPVSALCNKTNRKDGMGSVFERISVASMPPIYKPKTKTKSKKKIEPIPDTVTDIQIGQSIILYIDNLRNKIKNFATSIGDMQAKHKSETNLSKMTLKQKDDTIEKLQEELQTLRELKKAKSRTFNMGELLK